MAKKEKKQLTASQKQKKYKAIEKITFYGEFVSIATPYIVMGAINFDEWFKSTEGWKIGVGGSIAMALMGIAVFIITKKKEDKDSTTSGYVTLLLGWLATAFVLLLLSNIINEIASIMFFGSMGIAGALGLEITSKNYAKKSKLYKEGIEKAKSKIIEEEAYEEIKNEEPEEKKIIVKVKNR